MEKLPARDLEQPALAAYYGAMLAGAGQKDKAREFLGKLGKLHLLPEEQRFVDEARKKL
jgi:hypothetical protein